jgi:hypothetical protein
MFLTAKLIENAPSSMFAPYVMQVFKPIRYRECKREMQSHHTAQAGSLSSHFWVIPHGGAKNHAFG